MKYDQQMRMQSYLNELSCWCKENNVLPKPSKCQTMTVSFLKRNVPESLLSLESVALTRVMSIKLLGVTVQSNLKWDAHITEIVSKASRRLYTLCILRRARTPILDMVAVYTCYIRPILEYASQVWHSSINDQQTRAIENIQKRAARIILGLRYDSYVTALEVLGIPSLESRRDNLLHKFGNKLLNSIRFRDMLPPKKESVSGREFRAGTSSGLIVPKCRTERNKRSTIPTLARTIKL